MEGWAYITDDGSGVPRVIRSTPGQAWVAQTAPGEYVVTFPGNFTRLACKAALNNLPGFITAVPGDQAGLPHNQVRVTTLNPAGEVQGKMDFTIEVSVCDWPD